MNGKTAEWVWTACALALSVRLFAGNGAASWMRTPEVPVVAPVERDVPADESVFRGTCGIGGYRLESGVSTFLYGWGEGCRPEGDLVQLFVSEKADDGWRLAFNCDLSGCESNAVLAVEEIGIAQEGIAASRFFTIRTVEDDDGDGLPNGFEALVSKTAGDSSDTNGDGMPDGWQYANGFDPLSKNLGALSYPFGSYSDPDFDGLPNFVESLLGTNPLDPDTDRDGLADGVEIPLRRLLGLIGDAGGFLAAADDAEGTDPAHEIAVADIPSVVETKLLDGLTNPLDANNEGFVPVAVVWGDPSKSESEKYKLSISPESGSGERPPGWQSSNRFFGKCETNLFFAARGWRYGVNLTHLGTDYANVEKTDPDYVLCMVLNPELAGLDDPQSLLGVHEDSDGGFDGRDKTAYLYVKPLDPVLTIAVEDRFVIFEEAYEASPGELAEPRSTQTKLMVTVRSGSSAGKVEIVSDNADKIARSDGQPIVGNALVSMLPYREYSTTIEIGGRFASAVEGDVVMQLAFFDEGTNLKHLSPTAALTSVRLELETVYEAPENPCKHRHVCGVGEKLQMTMTPKTSEGRFEVDQIDKTDASSIYDRIRDAPMTGNGIRGVYTCPIAATVNPRVAAVCGNVKYVPEIRLVEPQWVVCKDATWEDPFKKGEVGPATLVTKNYVGPMNVSFKGIMVAEIPCEEEDLVWGFFKEEGLTNKVSLTHTADAGAGMAFTIKDGNYWMEDAAGRREPYINPSVGKLVWRIPIGWVRKTFDDQMFRFVEKSETEFLTVTTSRLLLVGGSTQIYTQVFVIDHELKASVIKFGNALSRSKDGDIELNGVRVK